MSELVRYAVEDGVATVTIDNPKALNALNADVLRGLEARLLEAAAADGVHGTILTGAGEKAFVAGADIHELSRTQGSLDGRAMSRRGQALTRRIEGLPRPVIACVNGFALGGGLELALACHFRYAVAKAKLGLPEVKLGLIPGYGGTQRLARAVGRGRATELILTGEPIDGNEAFRIGLVNRVFESRDDMLKAAAETLRAIGKRGPCAVRLALEALDRGLWGSLEDGLAVEADLFGLLCSTEDVREGTRAFLEKREPKFTGAARASSGATG